MLSTEEIARKLSDRNWSEVSRRTGLHERTIRRLVKRPQANVRVETVRKLSDYLSKG